MDHRTVEHPEHLRRLSVGYRNAAHIGDRVFPVQGVNRRTGDYKRYGRENMRPVEDVREPGTRSRQVEELSVDRPAYRLTPYALNTPVTDEELEEGQYEYPELEAIRTRNLTDRVYLGREKRIGNIARDVNVVQQNLTLAATRQWSDPVNSDPYMDSFRARMTVRRGCGRPVNTAIIPSDVLEALKLNRSLASRLPSNDVQVLTTEMIRQLLDVQQIIVPEVVEDLSPTGAAGTAPQFADVWGRDVIFCYINPNMQPEDLTFGVTLRLRQPRGPVRRWRQDPEKSTFVEVGYDETQVIICAEAAFLYKNAIPENWMPA